MQQTTDSRPASIVVLISGGGSNLQAILDAIDAGRIDARVSAVISDKKDAFGLVRARRAGSDAHFIDPADHDSRAGFDRALMECIDRYRPVLVVLAGYLRILSEEFVDHYYGRLLNIHPSLLPKFPGLKTHQRVLESGDDEHGVTVHFVSAELDAGPLIAQVRVPVHPDDDALSLAERVLRQEHRLYPLVIKWFIDRRLELRENTVLLDGIAVRSPIRLAPDSCKVIINGTETTDEINHDEEPE